MVLSGRHKVKMFAHILKEVVFKYEGQPRDKKGQFSFAWQKIGGQLGSNSGGVFNKDGAKHYVKFPKVSEQVHAEVASDKIHELMGVKTLNHEAHQIRGKTGSVTKWNDGIKPLGRHGWLMLDHKQKQQAVNAFMASALTKNWDVVGLAHDNLCKDKNGDLVLVDTGGSFQFRAMGEHKDFDVDANKEVTTFLNPEKTSGRVFRPLAIAHPELFLSAAAKLKTLTREDFVKATNGMQGSAKIVDTLLARRDSLVKRFNVVNT